MWSLGSILLEMISGFPLWLSLKSRVTTLEGYSVINYGLFGVAGRDNMKILNKQQQILGQGPGYFIDFMKKGYHCSNQKVLSNKMFFDMLLQMLCMQATHRISPERVMNHPFMKQ